MLELDGIIQTTVFLILFYYPSNALISLADNYMVSKVISYGFCLVKWSHSHVVPVWMYSIYTIANSSFNAHWCIGVC